MPRGPICPQHKCHPDECFYIHYPEAARPKGAPTEEEMRLALMREHIRRQNENIRRAQEAMSRNIVDARKQFEEAQKRNERDAG